MNFLKILAEVRNPVLDVLFQLCTYLGQDIIIIVIICILYWCVNKKIGYQIGLTFFASGLGLQALKITFQIPRPWVLDPAFKPVASAVPAATGYSFPSGHTQSATALYFPLALHAKKKSSRIVLSLLFLLVGFSRMYLGCHTPADVLAAIALTLIIGSGIHQLLISLKDTPNENFVIGLIMMIVSFLVFIYAQFLANRGTILIENAMDCCKAAGAGLGFGLGWYLERTYIKFSTTGTMRGKVIRFFIGISVTAFIEFGSKAVLPSGLIFGAFRYFILVLWVVCLYPFLIKKTQKNNLKQAGPEADNYQ